MIAIAWVDTSDGRRSVALRGAVVLIASATAFTIGLLMWEGPLIWLGGGLFLIGALVLAWARLRASRGLPLSDGPGGCIRVGARVRLLGIPKSLQRDLPADEWSELQAMVGEIFEVQKFDALGKVWIEKRWLDSDGQGRSYALALLPFEMEVVD